MPEIGYNPLLSLSQGSTAAELPAALRAGAAAPPLRTDRSDPLRPADESGTMQARQYRFRNSSLELRDGIWRVELRENSYYDTGFACGRLLAEADYPAVRLLRLRWARWTISLLSRAMHRQFARIRVPQRYLDELRGYADGAGVSYRCLFFLNFCFDVAKRYGFHCSSVAVLRPEATMVGRNTDLIPILARLALRWLPSIIADVAVPRTRRLVHVTPAFFVGVMNGFNEGGIVVTSHQVLPTREKSQEGHLATTLLQRTLLEEAATVEDADRLVRENPIQRCLKVMVNSARQRLSRIYEISPTGTVAQQTAESFVCCTTHFDDPSLQELHRTATAASRARLVLMNRLAAGVSSLAGVIALLQNHENGLDHSKTAASPTNAGTYQSFIFDVTERCVFISNGNTVPVSLSGSYQRVALP